jgi:hypothetical protein
MKNAMIEMNTMPPTTPPTTGPMMFRVSFSVLGDGGGLVAMTSESPTPNVEKCLTTKLHMHCPVDDTAPMHKDIESGVADASPLRRSAIAKPCKDCQSSFRCMMVSIIKYRRQPNLHVHRRIDAFIARNINHHRQCNARGTGVNYRIWFN